jgi:hypothetical protein
MKIRRLFATTGAALVLTLGIASAAHAADYPPTTSVQNLGSTVTTTTAAASTDPTSNSAGLPFTGSDSAALVWVGVAAVSTGTFAAWRFRRGPRTS